MFKNKYFIMGIGAGIVIGVLLLQLIVIGQQLEPRLSNNTPLTEQQLSDEQLKRAAEERGYKLVPLETDKEGEVSFSPSSSLLGTESAIDESKSKKSESAGKDVNLQTDKLPPSTSAEHPSQSAEQPESKKEKLVTLQIKANSTSKIIAEQLEQAGVIDEATKFDSYVISLHQQRKLRAGKFQFIIPSTHEQILKVLQSDPNG